MWSARTTAYRSTGHPTAGSMLATCSSSASPASATGLSNVVGDLWDTGGSVPGWFNDRLELLGADTAKTAPLAVMGFVGRRLRAPRR